MRRSDRRRRRSATPSSPPFRTIAIVGVGLIGGSVGLAARARGRASRVIGIDARDVLRERARARRRDRRPRATCRPRRPRISWSCARRWRSTWRRWRRWRRGCGPDAIVTDVGSTKRDIVAAAEAHGLDQFVGGHPLAGAATSGTASAREHLFRGRPWILTPSARSAPAPSNACARFAAALGATPTVLDAVAHDRLMAYVSHLPQVVASTLLADGRRDGGGDAASPCPVRAWPTRPGWRPAPVGCGRASSPPTPITSAEAMASLESALGPAAGAGSATPASVETTFASAARWRRAIKLIGEADRPQTWRGGAAPERTVPATRTYLEQTAPAPASTAWPEAGWCLARVGCCPASFYRYLYREVGRPWHWIRSPAVVGRAHPRARRQPGHRDSGCSRTTPYRPGSPSSSAPATAASRSSTSVCCPTSSAAGPDAPFLEAVVGRAWDGGTTRVWVHTCTLDHPRALTNYLAGGFRVVREEAYTARLETVTAR